MNLHTISQSLIHSDFLSQGLIWKFITRGLALHHMKMPHYFAFNFVFSVSLISLLTISLSSRKFLTSSRLTRLKLIRLPESVIKE